MTCRTMPIPARRALGFLPEGAPTYPEMSVLAFLRFTARVRGYARRASWRGASSTRSR